MDRGVIWMVSMVVLMVLAVQAVKAILRQEILALQAILPPLLPPLLRIVLPDKPREAMVLSLPPMVDLILAV